MRERTPESWIGEIKESSRSDRKSRPSRIPPRHQVGAGDAVSTGKRWQCRLSFHDWRFADPQPRSGDAPLDALILLCQGDMFQCRACGHRKRSRWIVPILGPGEQ